jgi:hypothetical protein
MTDFTSHAGVFFDNTDLLNLKGALAAVVPGPGPGPGPTPTPPGPWPIPGAVCLDLPWVSTAVSGRKRIGFLCEQKAVVRIIVPPAPGTGVSGLIALVEAVHAGVARCAVLSQTPLDFDTSGQATKWNVSIGPSVSFNLMLGTAQIPNFCMLHPGATYYLNLRNTTKSGAPTCTPGQDCSMFIDFNPLPK